MVDPFFKSQQINHAAVNKTKHFTAISLPETPAETFPLPHRDGGVTGVQAEDSRP